MRFWTSFKKVRREQNVGKALETVPGAEDEMTRSDGEEQVTAFIERYRRRGTHYVFVPPARVRDEAE